MPVNIVSDVSHSPNYALCLHLRYTIVLFIQLQCSTAIGNWVHMIIVSFLGKNSSPETSVSKINPQEKSEKASNIGIDICFFNLQNPCSHCGDHSNEASLRVNANNGLAIAENCGTKCQ